MCPKSKSLMFQELSEFSDRMRSVLFGSDGDKKNFSRRVLDLWHNSIRTESGNITLLYPRDVACRGRRWSEVSGGGANVGSFSPLQDLIPQISSRLLVELMSRIQNLPKRRRLEIGL
jgi:hypothetical protein